MLCDEGWATCLVNESEGSLRQLVDESQVWKRARVTFGEACHAVQRALSTENGACAHTRRIKQMWVPQAARPGSTSLAGLWQRFCAEGSVSSAFCVCRLLRGA